MPSTSLFNPHRYEVQFSTCRQGSFNTFKKEQFVNWVNFKGESIKTQVPNLNLTAELVTEPKQAYGALPFNTSTIQLLFGKVPEGKINMLSKQ